MDSAKRTSSPNRHLTKLRIAQPLISLSPITTPFKLLPDDAMTRLVRLRRRRVAASMEPIDEEAFDHEDKRTLADFTPVDTLQEAKKLFEGATLCTSSDETRMRGASVSSGHSLNWPSQSINPLYIPEPSTPSKKRYLIRKTDFCLSYSYFDPPFRALYDQLEEVKMIHVSHAVDNFIPLTVLFSRTEVKLENGNQKDAEL